MKSGRNGLGALLVCVAAVAALASGCARQAVEWEYMVLPVMAEGHERKGTDAVRFASVTPSKEELNKLGKDGWELVSSYLEMETAWPNFGNDNYVVGLQPNVRPQRVVLVFKRPRPGGAGLASLFQSGR